MGHIATLILAAGFSTRMQGHFKPLLPFHFNWPQPKTLNALEAVIALHARSGVEHIYVIGGTRESEKLQACVAKAKGILGAKQHIHFITNPQPERGMFSSICEGLKIISSQCSHVFIHPVDVALVRICTLQYLLKAKQDTPKTILIPSYKDKTGHPPLIPACFFKDILTYDGNQGLQGAIQSFPVKNIATPDSYMLFDMDTRQDYKLLAQKAGQQHILQPIEALELLNILKTSPQGIAHAVSVARIATHLAKLYVRKNKKQSINIMLTKVGALLHDMCKHEPKHERAAAKALREMGLSAIAPLVEEHNDCALDADKAVSEKELIYLADKYVYGQDPVPILSRFENKLNLYAHIPEAVIAIKTRLERAKSMEERVGHELGINVFEVATKILTQRSNITKL